MEQTKAMEILLGDIQEVGIRNPAPNPRMIDNFTVADFLLLNGVRKAPVKPGSIVTNAQGVEYVVLEYQMTHDKNGIKETVDVVKASHYNNACFTSRPMTISAFWQEFGESAMKLI